MKELRECKHHGLCCYHFLAHDIQNETVQARIDSAAPIIHDQQVLRPPPLPMCAAFLVRPEFEITVDKRHCKTIRTLCVEWRETESSLPHFKVHSPQKRRQGKAQHCFYSCQLFFRNTFNPAIPPLWCELFHPCQESLFSFAHLLFLSCSSAFLLSFAPWSPFLPKG
jgi:hypothetical protein